MMESEERCELCKYLLGRFPCETGNVYGICRRFPKVENKYIFEWCGEFTLKGQTQEVNDAI
jgi:hypothetical protein